MEMTGKRELVMKRHDRTVRKQHSHNTLKPRRQAHRDELRTAHWRTALSRAFRGGRAKRCGIALVCLMLAAAACSSGKQAAPEQPSTTVLATAVQEPNGMGRPPGGEDWVRPPLAGMRVDHPEEMSGTEGWLYATVSIKPPCAFLTDVSEELGVESPAEWEGRRLALSLSYPKVRFDARTQTLWNQWMGEVDIPIAHGDRVIVSSDPLYETIGDKEPRELYLFWDACAAHALAAPGTFWTSVEWLCLDKVPGWVWHQGRDRERVCVEDTRPWNQRDLLEQQGLAPSGGSPAVGGKTGDPPPTAEFSPPPFLDMYPYHPDMELELSKLVGVLSIEPASPTYYLERKCAYLYPTTATASQTVLWGDTWKHTGPDGQPLAVQLELPYPQVRYDENTGALWNGDIGPMVTGDRVIADPIAPPDFHAYGSNTRAKQPHEPQLGPCDKAGASAAILDIQPVEHYCTHNPPARHHAQCNQAMNQHNQTQNQLTLYAQHVNNQG